MKKLITVLTTVLVIGSLLTGCGNKKLADAFDEKTVITTAENVIEKLNNGDYSGVSAQVLENLQEKLSADILKSAMVKTAPNAGKFVGYTNTAAVGEKSGEEDLAVTVIVAAYENQDITYTITFNTDMKIVRLYMR